MHQLQLVILAIFFWFTLGGVLLQELLVFLFQLVDHLNQVVAFSFNLCYVDLLALHCTCQLHVLLAHFLYVQRVPVNLPDDVVSLNNLLIECCVDVHGSPLIEFVLGVCLLQIILRLRLERHQEIEAETKVLLGLLLLIDIHLLLVNRGVVHCEHEFVFIIASVLDAPQQLSLGCIHFRSYLQIVLLE